MVRKQIIRMLRGGDRFKVNKPPFPESQDLPLGDNTYQRLEYETGQTITIFGFRKNQIKTILSYLGFVITLGLLRLVFHWYPKLWITLTHDKTVLSKSQRLLVEDDYKGKWKTYATVRVQQLSLENGDKQVYYIKDNVLKENQVVTSFTYKSIRFILEDNKFVPLAGLSDGLPLNALHAFRGLSKAERDARLNIYGPNEIKVPLTPIYQLLFLEILTPFYAFQLFTITLWLVEGYIYFVIVIVILTILGVGGHVIQTRQNENNLRRKVKATDEIHIFNRTDGKEEPREEVSSTILVPGDLIQLKEGHVFCDAILLSGTCLVDESMLTGESIQVLKTPVANNNNLYNLEDATPHILFAGTRIVQVNSDLKAVVIQTGFRTSKGSLIRSIMYPPPMDYAFDRDSTKFCVFMFLIGVSCAVYIAITKYQRGIPTYDLVIKTLDSITILLPAALPATFTIGKLHALKNLRKKKIFCTNSKVLPGCGSIDVVCLDKTGTITEDKLDFIGVVPIGHSGIQKDISIDDATLKGMAVCHNLAQYEGALQGDHLEVQMFLAAGADIPEKSDTILMKTTTIKILERYQFSSNLRRMSVIIESSSGSPSGGLKTYEVFCKGSPEIIKSLCRNSSGISEDELLRLTRQGFRVISLATRKLEVSSDKNLQTLSREDIERDLDFLGYLVFENKLKIGSRDVIQELKRGSLVVKMITGDNIETAVSVAKECGILPGDGHGDTIRVLTSLPSSGLSAVLRGTEHFAVTGVVWNQLVSIITKEEELLRVVLPKIQVFARMASNQKQQVVEQYQGLGLTVCMCGDGANDCGALKAANVGISLTESESSMASHLTSQVQNISAVLDVVREGRSTMVTTVSIVKIILSANAIQYIGLLLLYQIDAGFTDFQFLYLDLHMLIYGFFIGAVDAHQGPLSPRPPTKSLLSWKPNLSMIAQLIPTIFFQLIALWLVRRQEWFHPYVHDTDDGNNFRSYENYVIFILALFQYGTLSVVYPRGKPYRKPMWTNWLLCFFIGLYLCLDVILCFGWVQGLLTVFELIVPSSLDFRLIIAGLGLGHLITAILIEEIVVEVLVGRFIIDRIQGIKSEFGNDHVL